MMCNCMWLVLLLLFFNPSSYMLTCSLIQDVTLYKKAHLFIYIFTKAYKLLQIKCLQVSLFHIAICSNE